MEQNCSDPFFFFFFLSTETVAWRTLVFASTFCTTLLHHSAPKSQKKSERMLCCAYWTNCFGKSNCWVHSFTVLIASRFVDNFIRCLTKDKNQHNKTLEYLVLIFLCGYSVNILMQNVSEQCLRTTRQCEIHVW